MGVPRVLPAVVEPIPSYHPDQFQLRACYLEQNRTPCDRRHTCIHGFFVGYIGGLKAPFSVLVCGGIKKDSVSSITVCRMMLFVKSVCYGSPRLLACHGFLQFYKLVSRKSQYGVVLQLYLTWRRNSKVARGALNRCLSLHTHRSLKEHVQVVRKVDTGSLDPFALFKYLLLCLHRAVNQPWMLGLVALRKCVRQRDIPFIYLAAGLDEIVRHC